MRILFFSLLIIFVHLSLTHSSDERRELYIQNGQIKLGVDLSSGGSIYFFSDLIKSRNLLNHFDRGRFIQQSYYGEKDSSYWVDKEWRWNPVQGGDYKGKAATVIEHKSTDTSLYVKSIPMHWANGKNINEARMEQWVTLFDKTVHIRFKFSYNGDKEHKARHQEMPAVFFNYNLPNLVLYQGPNPWTNDTLSYSIPGWPNELRISSENWAAYLDDNDYGIGVYTPGTEELTCYRYKGEAGPEGDGCSYFAPIRTLAINPGTIIEYDVFLTIGSIDQIRQRFYEIQSRKRQHFIPFQETN